MRLKNGVKWQHETTNDSEGENGPAVGAEHPISQRRLAAVAPTSQ